MMHNCKKFLLLFLLTIISGSFPAIYKIDLCTKTTIDETLHNIILDLDYYDFFICSFDREVERRRLVVLKRNNFYDEICDYISCLKANNVYQQRIIASENRLSRWLFILCNELRSWNRKSKKHLLKMLDEKNFFNCRSRIEWLENHRNLLMNSIPGHEVTQEEINVLIRCIEQLLGRIELIENAFNDAEIRSCKVIDQIELLGEKTKTHTPCCK